MTLGSDRFISPIFSDDDGNWWLQAHILVSGLAAPEQRFSVPRLGVPAALPIFTDWWEDQMGDFDSEDYVQLTASETGLTGRS